MLRQSRIGAVVNEQLQAAAGVVPDAALHHRPRRVHRRRSKIAKDSYRSEPDHVSARLRGVSADYLGVRLHPQSCNTIASGHSLSVPTRLLYVDALYPPGPRRRTMEPGAVQRHRLSLGYSIPMHARARTGQYRQISSATSAGSSRTNRGRREAARSCCWTLSSC